MDFGNNAIQLFPIEVKYNPKESSECSLIGELIDENNIEIIDTISIMEQNAANFKNPSKQFRNAIIPMLNSLINFMSLIWGVDEEFWGKDDFYDVGVSTWFKKLSSHSTRVTIDGLLFNIPDSLIHEYFDSDIMEINYEFLSNNSKKCLEDIEAYIHENSSLFNKGLVPKFTWSTPTDAIWIRPNRSICCRTLEDIFTLLKASTKVSSDIERSVKERIGNTLLLREYIPTLNEMFEFRVFVGGFISYSEYKILGISQKHTSCYYKDLSDNSELRAQIQSCIEQFFYSNTELMFEIFDIFNTMFVTFDVYISDYKNNKTVLITDIQPLLKSSHLLFNISDLKINFLRAEDPNSDNLRTVESESARNMIGINTLKGFVPEELLSISNSDLYNLDVIDDLEWMDRK
ncbi:hypothetical protein OJ253_265 [Cryptosporidium canis]|uniref:Cell division cycle protein 123 n=1 Tax=Cryptosporidium canis TaxID=195482 RepID=A0A9D5DNA6_9CRYT|nr:hypothetical protein OJ253_265 [Cryptosporidium canis]